MGRVISELFGSKASLSGSGSSCNYSVSMPMDANFSLTASTIKLFTLAPVDKISSFVPFGSRALMRSTLYFSYLFMASLWASVVFAIAYTSAYMITHPGHMCHIVIVHKKQGETLCNIPILQL